MHQLLLRVCPALTLPDASNSYALRRRGILLLTARVRHALGQTVNCVRDHQGLIDDLIGPAAGMRPKVRRSHVVDWDF